MRAPNLRQGLCHPILPRLSRLVCQFLVNPCSFRIDSLVANIADTVFPLKNSLATDMIFCGGLRDVSLSVLKPYYPNVAAFLRKVKPQAVRITS